MALNLCPFALYYIGLHFKHHGNRFFQQFRSLLLHCKCSIVPKCSECFNCPLGITMVCTSRLKPFLKLVRSSRLLTLIYWQLLSSGQSNFTSPRTPLVIQSTYMYPFLPAGLCTTPFNTLATSAPESILLTTCTDYTSFSELKCI